MLELETSLRLSLRSGQPTHKEGWIDAWIHRHIQKGKSSKNETNRKIDTGRETEKYRMIDRQMDRKT